MNYIAGLFLSSLLIFSPLAISEDFVSIESKHSVDETRERLVGLLNEKGIKLFLEVDHAKGAASVNQQISPTQLLVFGNPKLGTPLIKCAPSTGLDLPLKVLIYEDDAGKTRLLYTKPEAMAARHKVSGCDEVIKKMAGVLAAITGKAAN